MAEAIGQGRAGEGVPYQLFDMGVADRSDVITEIFKAKAIIVGSSTLNQGALPTIFPILEELKGLKLRNKIGAAFGSYGWGGEAVKIIEEHLNRCKIPLATEGVRVKWQPKPDDLTRCKELGQKIAHLINAPAATNQNSH